MIKKNNKTCIVCGTKYTFCSGCSDFDHLPRWMGIFHDENCHDIFNIINDYKSGSLNIDEAAISLEKCNLSDKEHFHHAIVDAINEVQQLKKRKKKARVETQTTNTNISDNE